MRNKIQEWLAAVVLWGSAIVTSIVIVLAVGAVFLAIFALLKAL